MASRARQIPLALLAALVCALVCALGAPRAGARIVQAQTILPPGQSGYVSITGLTSGTGSPHLYDQLQDFIDFKWKSATFGQPGVAETPRPGVTIVRDSFGVPAVTAGNVGDMWWGAGYAIAEDRLLELDLFRHATEGDLAALAGKSYLGGDEVTRQDLYRPAELDAMFARLPPGLQALFTAYTSGVSAYIARVRADPLELPGEYAALGTLPAPWTVHDSVAIGVYLARTIPTIADPEDVELANMRAVQLSGAKALDALVPLIAPGSPTTVPRSAGLFPSQPGRTAAELRAAERRSIAYTRTLPFPTATVSGTPVTPTSPSVVGPGGSYAFALRRSSDHHALLFNGPELGFTAPEKLVEVELHAPGVDLRGMTAPGVPVIGSGFNGNVAWGVTSGESDTDDLYVEPLVPGHPEQYFHNGRILHMDCVTETLPWTNPPSGLLHLSSPVLPGSGSEQHRFCRTLHGPVEARAGNVAYARRYAAWGRELETLQGLTDLESARDVYDVDRAMREVTWNENLMAADSSGNIGYWHPGLSPLRPLLWDERLPYPGDGRAEWRGLLSPGQMPHVINPRQGWLANWNNDPSAAWTSGDGSERKRLDGPWFRAGLLFTLVKALARNPTFTGMQDVIRQAGTTAQQFPRARRFIARAAHGASGGAAVVLNTLLAWNGSYAQTGPDGKVDAGLAAWQAFLAAAAQLATRPFGAAAAWLVDENVLDYLDPGYSPALPYHYFDATHLQSYALGKLGPGGYRAAASAAYGALVKRFGSSAPASWRQPRPLFDFQGLAGEQPPPLPFFDRGTYEEFVELGP